MANYYYKSTGTTWNAASSWDSPIPGTTATVIPTFADDVIFNATSGSTCNVNVAGATLFGSCKSITTTTYVGTITLNVDLLVYGNHVIGATTVFAGSAWYCANATGSITSNSVSFPNFKLNKSAASFILTLNDILNVVNITQDNNGGTTNGFSVNVNGSMTIQATGVLWSGTTVYNLIGTGNFGMTSTLPAFSNTINILSGNYTFLSLVRFSGATFTYTAGTVNTTTNSSLLDLFANNSITSKNVGTGNEIVFNNVRAGSAGINGTTTLGSDMRVVGNFEVGNFNGYNFNQNTIYVTGNILNPTSVANGGTSVMEMEGSVAATINGGNLTRSLTINKTGAVAVTVVVNGTTGLTWGAAGRTLLVPASQTLILSTALTLSGNGSTFNCSAGTFTPVTQNVLIIGAISINMGSTNTFYNLQYTLGLLLGYNVTMLSTIRITNNFSLSGTGSFNGNFDIIVGGNLTTGSGSVTNSTAGRKVTLTGLSTGVSTIVNWSTGSFQLEIDCVNRGFALTGILTVVSLNYLATNIGSFTTTGSILSYNNNLSINMNNSTNSWNIISGSSGIGPTLTLLSDVYCNTLGAVGNTDKINGPGFNVVTTGSTATISNVSGTGGIKFVGSSNATWNQNVGTTNALRITFAKTSPASVIIPNNFNYTGSLMKWDSGNVTHSTTMTLSGSVTMDTTSAVPWNNITIAASATITINSLFYIVGTLAITSGTITFSGTAGWNCGTLTCSTASTIIVLREAITYTTTTSVTMLGTNAGRITMRSNAPTATYAIWTLQNPATQSIAYVNAQGIDSNAGMTIYSFKGVVLTSLPALNWYDGASQGTKAFTFVS